MFSRICLSALHITIPIFLHILFGKIVQALSNSVETDGEQSGYRFLTELILGLNQSSVALAICLVCLTCLKVNLRPSLESPED